MKPPRSVAAPRWLKLVLMPTLAGWIAREVRRQNPGLDAEAIAAKMRADLGATPDPEALRLVERVVARLPPPAAGSAATAAAASVSSWVLVAANLVPLYGVLAWDWPVFPLIALFWMENVIVGALNVARMLAADPGNVALWAGKLFMVPFFCVHYGMFTAAHGTFVFGMFGGKGYDARGLWPGEAAVQTVVDYGLAVPVAALALSHLFSFVWNYLGRGEFRSASLAALMGTPYARVVVLHLTIIFGGMAAMALDSPVWALVLLVGIKTGVDLLSHRREHVKAAARRAAPPRPAAG